VDRVTERDAAIRDTVRRIRSLEDRLGINRESLDMFKAELLKLAERSDLFPLEDFPPPAETKGRTSCLYRISEDPDHRFALYINAAKSGVDTPPHYHTTWAIVVGILGEELNRFYQRADHGVNQTATASVTKGTGVTMLPDDLHSIHIHGPTPVINFHMYGLALEQLQHREYFDANDNEWKVFPAHEDIRDAR